MGTLHNPHDKLFKSAMTDLRVARDFFSHHLPASILAAVDLNALKLCPNSYVDPTLQVSLLVFYHGPKPYTGARHIRSLIEAPKALIEQAPSEQLVSWGLKLSRTDKIEALFEETANTAMY